MRTPTSSLALAGAIALLAAVPATAAASSTPTPSASSSAAPAQTVTTSAGVEVTTYGTESVAVDNRGQESRVFQALHGVRRLPDVTVVYWSLGWQEEPWLCCDLFGPFGASVIGQEIFAGTISPTWISLVLPEQGRLLTATPDVTRRFGTQPAAASQTDALPDEPGVMAVLFSVLPPLPDDVDTVDVTLGNAGLVLDVPVEEGLLEPVAEGPVCRSAPGGPRCRRSCSRPCSRRRSPCARWSR